MRFVSRVYTGDQRLGASNDPTFQTDALTAGAWHHVAIVWRTENHHRPGPAEKWVYVDGRQIAHHRAKSVYYFRGFGTRASVHGQGAYDDVIIWRRPLSGPEVREVFQGQWDAALASKAFTRRKLAFGTRTGKQQPEDGIVQLGEAATVEFRQELVAGAASATRAELRVIDYYGRDLGAVWRGATDGKSPVEARATFTPGELGTFLWQLQLFDAGGTLVRKRDMASFAVLSRQMLARRPHKDGFWGCNIEGNDYAPGNLHPAGEKSMDTAVKLGVSWTRSLDTLQITYWRWAEPKPGQWVYHDKLADAIRKRGLQVMGVLTQPPLWAAKDAGRLTPSTYPKHPWLPPMDPRSLDEWANYVRRVVGHYKGTITTWEIWNEPNSSGWRGSYKEYFELSRRTYQAAKAANANCTVVGFGGIFWKKNSLRMMKDIIGRGVLKYCDAVSVHSGAFDQRNAALHAGERIRTGGPGVDVREPPLRLAGHGQSHRAALHRPDAVGLARGGGSQRRGTGDPAGARIRPSDHGNSPLAPMDHDGAVLMAQRRLRMPLLGPQTRHRSCIRLAVVPRSVPVRPKNSTAGRRHDSSL
jgi:hypothetical protein